MTWWSPNFDASPPSAPDAGSDNESDQTLRSPLPSPGGCFIALSLPSVNTNPSNGCHKLGVSDIMSVFIAILKCVLNKTRRDNSQLKLGHSVGKCILFTTLCECVGITAACTGVQSSTLARVMSVHRVSPPPGADTGHWWHLPPGLINISSKHFNTDSKYLTAHHNSLCCVIWEACATWLESICPTNGMCITWTMRPPRTFLGGGEYF